MIGAHIIEGELPAALRTHPAASFDACLTDPPYGLRFLGRRWDYDVPSIETWAEVYRVLKPGAPLLAFGGARTWHRLAVAIEDAGFELRDQIAWVYAQGFPKHANALKPAFEPILVARKPLAGTVAENVARHGVGTLAIDACRLSPRPPRLIRRGFVSGRGLGYESGSGPQSVVDGGRGRWPANVILDDEVANDVDVRGADITRFFFCPRARGAERRGNPHPTVKPLALTTYLARLIMPDKPGALLVPFAGSGSEVVGALRAGWPSVLGVERDASYVAIAAARVRVEAA